MKCQAESCKEAASASVEGSRYRYQLCERHAEDLRRSRAFWTPGKLTLDPMDPSRAQLGLAGSHMEIPR